VSTIPAIATVLLGVLTGHLLRSGKSGEEKTAWMFVAGNLMLLLGATMDMWLPINKNLWTSSFSVFMGGWALVCLAMFYWFIDVRGWKRWATPLVIYGMNAIAVYVLAGLIAKSLWMITVTGEDGAGMSLYEWIFATVFAPLASPINASLLFGLAFVVLIFLFAWILWKKRWFIKI
jgi:predicted acyltransferase